MPRLVRAFMARETSPGIVVLAMTALALVIANSPLAGFHHRVFTSSVGHAIDAGPMVLFFLLVSLEIKRELVEGDLSKWSQAALPVIAALGGMIVPGLAFIAINAGVPANFRGWGIPTATDIAFSLAVLGLANGRIPPSLKVFLASLAIIDDLGAIAIISLFYATSAVGWAMLGLAALGGLALIACNRLKAPLWLYGVAGVGIWACLLQTGVHPTLAGVAVGLAVPASRAERLEHALQPFVAYLVVPVFVLANAGVTVSGLTTATLTDGLFLGIAVGLFVGKQAGVMAASWLLIRFSPARLPAGATWRSFYGTAILTGIGFTMSLFIGKLAFQGDDSGTMIRLGVLVASLASAVLGLVVLLVSRGKRQNGSSTA